MIRNLIFWFTLHMQKTTMKMSRSGMMRRRRSKRRSIGWDAIFSLVGCFDDVGLVGWCQDDVVVVDGVLWTGVGVGVVVVRVVSGGTDTVLTLLSVPLNNTALYETLLNVTTNGWPFNCCWKLTTNQSNSVIFSTWLVVKPKVVKVTFSPDDWNFVWIITSLCVWVLTFSTKPRGG